MVWKITFNKTKCTSIDLLSHTYCHFKGVMPVTFSQQTMYLILQCVKKTWSSTACHPNPLGQSRHEDRLHFLRQFRREGKNTIVDVCVYLQKDALMFPNEAATAEFIFCCGGEEAEERCRETAWAAFDKWQGVRGFCRSEGIEAHVSEGWTRRKHLSLLLPEVSLQSRLPLE